MADHNSNVSYSHAISVESVQTDTGWAADVMCDPTMIPYDEEIDDGFEGGNIAARPGCCAGPAAFMGRCGAELKDFGLEVRDMARQADVGGWLKRTCTVSTLKKTFPIIEWLPKYRFKHLQGDFIAGLTVGLTVIPQGLAYASVAGLSPEYGLYSSFMGCFVYMFLGTSKDITLGPTALMSLLTSEFGETPVPKNATYAILLSLISGIVLFFMGLLHLGFVVDYISHPVVNSFKTAAAITIAWSQVKKWLELSNIPQDFPGQVYWIFNTLYNSKLYSFVMGVVCMLVLFGLKKLRDIDWKKDEKHLSKTQRVLKYLTWLISVSRNVIVLVLASGMAAIFLRYNMKPFGLTGYIKAGIPPWQAPNFTFHYQNTTLSSSTVFANIGLGFAIVPLLAIVETISISNNFARKNNYVIDPDQELLAIGTANILGCFVGSFPVTGSFSRTAVNSDSGVMTPGAGVWTAALVLLALAFLTPLFFYIPDPALAAVIIMAVMDMCDFTLLPRLWKVKKFDLLPWIVSFVCGLAIGIEWGVVLGVLVSLLSLLYPWSRPSIKINKAYDSNEFYKVLTVSQGLFYPGVQHFQRKIHAKAFTVTIKGVILDMRGVANSDYSSVECVEQLLEDFAKKKKRLIFCNLKAKVLDIYLRAKIKNFVHLPTVEDAIQFLTDEAEAESMRTVSAPVNRPNGGASSFDHQAVKYIIALPDELAYFSRM